MSRHCDAGSRRGDGRNLLIRASAGTGKTYQLSSYYLRLVLSGLAPDHILATTFTRKAAGEIQQRVIQRLAAAARDGASARALGEQLGIEALDQKACQRSLKILTERLHRLRISTLDSFFVQLTRTLCLDLGIPVSWRIADTAEIEQMHTESLGIVVRETRTDALQQIMHMLDKGQTDWRITRKLREAVDHAHELYLDADDKAWNLPKRKPVPSENEDRQLLGELVQLRDRLDDALGSRLPAALDKLIEAMNASDWKAVLGATIIGALSDPEPSYFNKPLPPEIVGALQLLKDRAAVGLAHELRNQLDGIHQATRLFDRAYTRTQRAHRAFSFSELARRLASSSFTADAVNVAAYRLDAPIEAVLVDEFQDTSRVQWQVLRPFAKEVATGAGESGGKARGGFFCVGDVKQAIYGWRGGDARLMEALGHEGLELTEQQLNESRRSAPAIIEVVNRLNKNLSQFDKLKRPEQKAAQQWEEQFPEHRTCRKELPGRATLSTPSLQESDSDAQTAVLDEAVRRIEQVIGQSPELSIAVLVRKNDTVNQMIHLLRGRGIGASEEGGSRLDDSPAVELILTRLHLADHPHDRAAAYHLARSPWGESLGWHQSLDRRTAQQVARNTRRALAEWGLARCVQQWVRDLTPFADARDRRRLNQLLVETIEYETDLQSQNDPGLSLYGRPRQRTSHFIQWVRSRRVSDPSQGTVRVMTIHQSKGLQFDVVVLPELNTRFMQPVPHLVYDRDSPLEPIRHVCRYASPNLDSGLDAGVRRVRDVWIEQYFWEQLCLLYVAMTRAKQQLHLLVKPSGRSLSRDPAGLLQSALLDGELLPSGFHTTLAENRAEPLQPESPAATAAGSSARADAPSGTVSLPRFSRERLARLRGPVEERVPWRPTQPSAMQGASRRLLGPELDPHRARARAIGTAVHSLFERIEWLEKFDESDAHIDEAVRSVAPDGLVDVVRATFREALSRTSIRELLSRRTYQQRSTPAPGETRWIVRTELPVAGLVDGRFVRGTVDRLVVQLVQGRPVWADVVDFKTDDTRGAEVDSLAEHYRPQIDTYRHLVARLLGIEKTAVGGALAFVSAGRVVRF